MAKKRRCLEDLLAQTCRACDEEFDTMQGLMAHQSASRKCAWYKKGKLKAVFADVAEDEPPDRGEGSSTGSDSQPGHEDAESSDEEEDLMFVPLPVPSSSGCNPPCEASSSGSRIRQSAIQLDDDEDTRVEDVDKTAGRVVGEGRTMMDAWKRHFAKQNDQDADCGDREDNRSLWEPFDTEMDWEVASWCVKEGISQGAVDRFLNIPNVREKLGLSYHNMRSLLQKVDSIPERSPWMEQWLTFKDRPGETHLVQFRDIIAAIKALLGNPAHADRIVYRPRRIFSNTSRKNRIYTEMWTGRWWNAVQVRRP
ncbi:uncharacterized protein B0H18DRAFT_888730, partial [Fomitopsis serialis]|uniref:uncharacterized protein n=1 Tax=Fomitopsis serialis TaxID=139415 RepID=UPI00200770B3